MESSATLNATGGRRERYLCHNPIVIHRLNPLQLIRTFMPWVILFGGKSFDQGSACIIGDLVGAVLWLPPGDQPGDGSFELHQEDEYD